MSKKFEVIASPHFTNGGRLLFGHITLAPKAPEASPWTQQADHSYRVDQDVARVEVQTEESIRKLSGAAGWGLVGALALGPVGLLLGALWGGRKQDRVCFLVELRDGKQFIALGDPAVYRLFHLAAATGRAMGEGIHHSAGGSAHLSPRASSVVAGFPSPPAGGPEFEKKKDIVVTQAKNEAVNLAQFAAFLAAAYATYRMGALHPALLATLPLAFGAVAFLKVRSAERAGRLALIIGVVQPFFAVLIAGAVTGAAPGLVIGFGNLNDRDRASVAAAEQLAREEAAASRRRALLAAAPQTLRSLRALTLNFISEVGGGRWAGAEKLRTDAEAAMAPYRSMPSLPSEIQIELAAVTASIALQIAILEKHREIVAYDRTFQQALALESQGDFVGAYALHETIQSGLQALVADHSEHLDAERKELIESSAKRATTIRRRARTQEREQRRQQAREKSQQARARSLAARAQPTERRTALQGQREEQCARDWGPEIARSDSARARLSLQERFSECLARAR